MEEEKKKNSNKSGSTLGVVLIALLMIGLSVACGWFGNQLWTEVNKKDTKDEVENKEDEIISLTKEEVSYYDFIIDHFNKNFSATYPLKVKDLTNQDILRVGFELGNIGYSTQSFSATSLHDSIAKVFGSDVDYTDEDIQCLYHNPLETFFSYDSGIYTLVGNHNHCICIILAKRYFISAEKEKDIIRIKEKNIYYGTACGTSGGETQFYKYAPNKELFYEASSPEEVDFDKMYDEYKNELPLITYIFQKDSKGNYGLKEIIVE